MHLMFGLAGQADAPNETRFEPFRKGISALYSTNCQEFGSGSTRIGITGQGQLTGGACEGNICLTLLGSVHAPLPGWHSGSPLDNPNVTAAFLLHRYRERGIKFLDDTIGAFIVALYDADENRLILANDPQGMRTAYFTQTPDGFTFSSTLYALNCAFDGGLDIDRSMEDFLLGYEFLPWQQTLYKNVFSLAPGMILEWRNGAIQQHASVAPDCSVWRLENLLGNAATEDKVGKALYDLFMQCLSDVLPSTNRVAVLMGGFDSALIAAACRRLGKEVDTYTFHFPENRYNQAYAEEVAQMCGATHQWVEITPQILKDGLTEYPLIFSQPSGMPHYLIQTAHVLRQMQKDGHTHCLTGDGCDEIFLGYPTVFKRAIFFQRHQAIPSWIIKFGIFVLRHRLVETFIGHPARFIRNFLAIASRPMPRRGHISNRIFDDHSLRHLRKYPVRQSIDSESILAALAFEHEALSPLRLAYHGKSMPGLNKMKFAGISTVSGLTVLSPFQHPYISEFARSLPEDMLRPAFEESATTGKRILMRAAAQQDILPAKIIYQKKASPISGMADRWYLGILKDSMLNRIESLPFQYNKKYVYDLLSFKLLEELFRRVVSLGHYVLNAPALLVTYASYNFSQGKKHDRQ